MKIVKAIKAIGWIAFVCMMMAGNLFTLFLCAGIALFCGGIAIAFKRA